MTNARFVVVSGGVISGIGKGIVSASIGKILQEHGYTTTLIKIDPYINYDAGTLRPTEHGEVWVTADGGEIDQDLGTYERFINRDIPKKNSITTGQIYKTVIDRERHGGYLGQTVQFIPHILDEIIRRICAAAEGYDFAIIEIGGTVGDYENAPFLYALKALKQKHNEVAIAHVLVTYLPIPMHINEMKSRPTRQALHMLGEHGIIPQFVVCRAAVPLDDVRKQKIQEFAYLPINHIISAPDTSLLYQVPLEFEKQELGKNILAYFGLASQMQPYAWTTWKRAVDALRTPARHMRIAVIGKYLGHGDYTITDSYLSIYHALLHAGAATQTSVEIVWGNAQHITRDTIADMMRNVAGIIVPGGFGIEGVEGKIEAIRYAREQQIPFLGICYGMQLAVVEYARSQCGMHFAHTTEVMPTTPYPVVVEMKEMVSILAQQQYGGSMRLGAYDAYVTPESHVAQLYGNARRIQYRDGAPVVVERHRHRYEINPRYVEQLRAAGLVFSGIHQSNDGTELMEFLELPHHPFFIATQAHPEFMSRLENPHPLFTGLIAAAVQYAVDIHADVEHDNVLSVHVQPVAL